MLCISSLEVSSSSMVECSRRRPDVVLMDVNMTRMDGVEATRQIRKDWPETAVIGLSMLDKDGQPARAMADAGAAAFLSKSEDASRLIETILRSVQPAG